MFERFTHAARDVVVQAQVAARDLDQSPIGTQHLLIALLTDTAGPVTTALAEQGVDARYVRAEILRRVGAGPRAEAGMREESDAEDKAALKAIGIDLDAVRKAIEENFGPGSLRLPKDPVPEKRSRFARLAPSKGHVPFSPRAKKVLELSLREALRLKHKFIAPEHIMLGILRENSGLAVQILAEAQVDTDRVTADLVRALDAHVA
jgi:ATP-dependent Clp protease ATP-binding subunit ClpA